MTKDIEQDNASIQYLTGYASLADFISKDADHSAVVCKRFDKLAARNLLYLQVELGDLEARQEEFDLEDVRLGRDLASWQSTKECARDLISLKYAANATTGPAQKRSKERLDLIMETREVMRQYRKLKF